MTIRPIRNHGWVHVQKFLPGREFEDSQHAANGATAHRKVTALLNLRGHCFSFDVPRTLSGNPGGLGFQGNGKGATKELTLKEEWDRLDSETRQWLLDNPACVMVTRTVSAKIKEVAAGPIEVDEHGQMLLTREDLDFIRGKGAAVGAGEVSEELQFFDATQPRKRE
jgi:hypothetical protein